MAIAATSANASAQGVAVVLAAGVVHATDPAPHGPSSTPAYMASLQGGFATYFAIEAELAHWRRTNRRELGPHTITGPNGVLGQVGGTTIIDTHRFWNVGINVLVRSTGPVRVFGGAGASLSMDDSGYSQESFGCSPSLDQRVCTQTASTRVRGPMPVIRGLGGIEVPLRTHVGVYGAVRVEAAAWEDRRNPVSGVGGLRFSFE